jgi:hypothetical protein
MQTPRETYTKILANDFALRLRADGCASSEAHLAARGRVEARLYHNTVDTKTHTLM